MFKKERVSSLLDAAVKEMNLLIEMSKYINEPDDFVSSTSGLIVFRACGMSIQYITESFVKIRNLCGNDFFKPYKSVPWPSRRPARVRVAKSIPMCSCMRSSDKIICSRSSVPSPAIFRMKSGPNWNGCSGIHTTLPPNLSVRRILT